MKEDALNASWPKLPNGTVDWELVFEAPDTGLIQLIEAARQSKTLIDCTAMIIQTLFTRDGDEDVRTQYTKKLAIVAVSEVDDVSGMATHTSAILRSIKDDRIKRAAEWAIHKQEREVARKQEELHEERQKRVRAGMDETEIAFSDVFCDAFDQKFQAMWAGVSQQPTKGKKLPFTVSSDFAGIFENVVRDPFMPWIIAKCRYIISEAKHKKSEQQHEYLEERLNDPRTQKELRTIWNETWQHFMQEEEYPKKPKEDRKGFLGTITRAVKDTIVDDGEYYTMEDWDHEVEIIDKQNAETREVRARLLAPSTVYQAPTEEDLTRLMNMFSIIPGDLRKQISSLRQIAEEDESAVRLYESYAKGKNLELALIAVSFQNSDIFLGDKQMLVHLLRGRKRHELELSLPFLMREMGDLFDPPAKPPEGDK